MGLGIPFLTFNTNTNKLLQSVDVSFVIFSDDSAVQLDQDKKFPDVKSPDSHQRQPGCADSVRSKAARGLTSHPSISPDHLNRDLTWSIREEVERLMSDQTTFAPHTSSQTGKAKKQPVRMVQYIEGAILEQLAHYNHTYFQEYNFVP